MAHGGRWSCGGGVDGALEGSTIPQAPCAGDEGAKQGDRRGVRLPRVLRKVMEAPEAKGSAHGDGVVRKRVLQVRGLEILDGVESDDGGESGAVVQGLLISADDVLVVTAGGLPRVISGSPASVADAVLNGLSTTASGFDAVL